MENRVSQLSDISSMKKVLIIGFFWPYRPGSRRTIGLAKYLPEFGWQPIILTPTLLNKPDPQFRVIETPYRDVLSFWKRLFKVDPDEHIGKQIRERFGITSKESFVDLFFTFCEAIITYPDIDRGWKPFAVKAGSELLQQENIDVMVSISPATRHLIASDLKAKYKIPWLADFPDLWSQNHYYQYLYGHLRRLIDRRLELKTLSKADALVTTSEPWAEKLRMLHKRKPVYAITHGFDPALVNTPPVSLTSKFTVTYTGIIYTGKQNPSRLFAALRELISDGTVNQNDIEVRFYGTGVVWLDREIEQYGLSDIVKHYKRVPKQVALEKQRESQVLLLLDWDDPREKGVYTAKVFEYLAARRPILAIGGSDDVIKELLHETKAGICALTVEDIKNMLRELYQEYKLKGEVVYKGDESEISKYSNREMTRKFSEILDHLIAR